MHSHYRPAFRDLMVLDHSIAPCQPEIALFPGYRRRALCHLQSSRQRSARCGHYAMIRIQREE